MLDTPATTGFIVGLVRKRWFAIGPDIRLYLGLPRSKRIGLTTFDDVDIESDDAEPIAIGDDWHWLAWMPKRANAFVWADLGVAETHAVKMKALGYTEVVVEFAARPGVIPPNWPV